jgi:hypothetical protein
MPIQWNSIKQNKPAIFDWLVFIFSMSVGFIYPSLKDFFVTPAFSNWMLATLVLYVAGVCLKHRPLYYRLAKAGNPQTKIPYLLFLIIGHWFIMVSAVVFAEAAFRRVTGISPTPPATASGFGIIATVIAALITWLAFRPGGKSSKPLAEARLFKLELAADVLLISGVAMLSFVFWEKIILALMVRMPIHGMGDIVFLFLFTGITYVLFYLPLRYLYLIEDHFNRQAWKRLVLIFTLVLVRGLFTALSF